MKPLPYDKVKQLIAGEGIQNSPSYLENVIEDMASLVKNLRRNHDFLDTKEGESAYTAFPLTGNELQTVLNSFEQYAREPWLPRVGLYISTLLNASKDTDINLNMPAFFEQVENMGYGLYQKNVFVTGSVGLFAGCGIRSGILRIVGSATDLVGMSAEGGRIIITKDVKEELSSNMSAGSIEVHGSAKTCSGLQGGAVYIKGDCGELGASCGPIITGGIIHVDGKIGKIDYSRITGGDIYHQGNLIVKDGKRVS